MARARDGVRLGLVLGLGLLLGVGIGLVLETPCRTFITTGSEMRSGPG